MGLSLVTPPASLPLHVAEARLHLRQDVIDEDAHIIATIAAATDMAKNECQSSFVACRWRLTLDCVPYQRMIELENGPVYNIVSIKFIGYDGVQVAWPSTEWVADLTRNPARISPRFGKIWMLPLPQIATIEILYDAGYAAPIATDATANTITPTGLWRTQSVGDTIRVSNSGGALPAPLQETTDYFIAGIVGNGYTLSSTSGGAVIDLTDVGSGLNFIGEVPAGVQQWISLRIGSMHENRESDQMMRGTVLSLPYLDALLDPYRAVSY